MSVSARLAELGIDLPQIAPPVAAYIPAKVHGDLVYTAGQLPFVSGALPATGKVGDGRDHRRPGLGRRMLVGTIKAARVEMQASGSA